MSMARLGPARARHDALVLQRWRDWCRYLQARRDLLASRQVPTTATQVVFEGGVPDSAAQRRAAEGVLKALPRDVRQLFDQVVESRRVLVQAQEEQAARQRANGTRPDVVDVDAVEAAVLTTLLDEAEGRVALPDIAHGWGRIPGEGGTSWAVNVPQVQGAPADQDYDASEDDDGLDVKKRLLLALALLLGGALIILIWWVWPGGARGPRLAAHVPQPLANGREVPVWPLHDLLLTRTDGVTTTMPLSTTMRMEAWPTVSGTLTTTAFARGSSVWPLQLCVPPDVLRDLAGLQLLSGGDVPPRSYTLSPTLPTGVPVDMVLDPCQPPQSPATSAELRRYGVIQATPSLPEATVGEGILLHTAGQTLTLTMASVAIAGPGEQDDLPAANARVTVVLTHSVALDVPALAPTLLLPSGEAVQATIAATAPTSATLHYLIPMPTTPLDALWRVTAADGTTRRWRLALAAPPTREQVIYERVQVGAVQAHQETTTGQWHIQFDITNTGSTPLRLLLRDISVRQDELAIPIGTIEGVTEPLQPQETRTVTLPLPNRAASSPVLVTVGRMQVRIAITEP